MGRNKKTTNGHIETNGDTSDGKKVNSQASLQLGPFSNELEEPISKLQDHVEILKTIAGVFEKYKEEADAVRDLYPEREEKDRDIDELKTSLKQMARARTEDENRVHARVNQLKVDEDTCEKERQGIQRMQNELKVKFENEKREHDARAQQDRLKAKKTFEAFKCELEVANAEKIRDLEQRNQTLTNQVKEREDVITEKDTKLEKKKERYNRDRSSLETKNQVLKSELQQMESDLAIKPTPRNILVDGFHDISDRIRNIANTYFKDLPEHESFNAGEVEQQLHQAGLFRSTPFSKSDTSRFLRLVNVEHLISIHICNRIWQPFFSDGLEGSPATKPLLEMISQRLSTRNEGSASAWRALTLRGLNPTSVFADSRINESLVQDMKNILQLLLEPSVWPSVENALTELIDAAIKLWGLAQQDGARIEIHASAHVRHKEGWDRLNDVAPSNIHDFENQSDTPDVESLCLFPKIHRFDGFNETAGNNDLHSGKALFADNNIFTQGKTECKYLQDELDKGYSIARAKVNARRNSLISPGSHT
ncbi:MAG: hypothetical protein M1833_001786 [Piccolia ochrophora]|nr:MAG: hypothetical protein M1833_001786 [Piccolia ochrophora]